MKHINLKQLLIIVLVMATSVSIISFTGNSKKTAAVSLSKPADPLPSWNDGALKKAIIDYVKKVTNSADPGFIPVEDRIATFDNDGTLWAEEPTIEVEYAKEALKSLIQKNPELAKQQPYKAIIEKDKAYLTHVNENVLVGAII